MNFKMSIFPSRCSIREATKRRNAHHMCEKITEPLSAKAKQYSEAEMK
jgi:hypothetical protein